MSFEDVAKQIRRHIKGAGKIVRQLLKDEPDCRNDDKLLMLRVFQKFLNQAENGKVILTLDNISEIPSAETIIRTRAKIQNDEGVYLPTDPDVRRRRGISEQVYREWAQTNF